MSHLSQGERDEIKNLQNACEIEYTIAQQYTPHDLTRYKKALKKIETYLHAKRDDLAGFQAGQSIPGADFAKYMEYHVNTIGDTYQEAPFRLSNKWMERAVIRFYSQMWRAKFPAKLDHEDPRTPEKNNPNEAWGHILTMGCTEGNMYAIRNARDYLQGRYTMFEKATEDKGVDCTPDGVKKYLGNGPLRVETVNAQLIKVVSRKSVLLKAVSSQVEGVSAIFDPNELDNSLDSQHDVVDLKAFTKSQYDDLIKKDQVDVRVDDDYPFPKPRSYGAIDGQDSESAGTLDAPAIVRLSKGEQKPPVILYSTSSHYSISKIKDMLEIKTPNELGFTYMVDGKQVNLPGKIKSNHDGTINMKDLIAVATVLVENDHPLIIITNYGTTFTGAHDQPVEIYNQLKQNGLLKVYQWVAKHSLYHTNTENRDADATHPTITRPNFWIHVDGALGAAYGSLFSDASDIKRWIGQFKPNPHDVPQLPIPDFRFNNEASDDYNIDSYGPVMSIAMSGHKFLGAPMPTGIYMTLRKYKLDFSNVPYIGSADTTLAGSRSGLATMVMWAHAANRSVNDYAKNYIEAYQLALYAKEQLDLAFRRLNDTNGGVTPVYHVPGSLAVLFKQPKPEIVSKHSLSTDSFVFTGYSDDRIDAVHIFCMPHVTKEKIDEICNSI